MKALASVRVTALLLLSVVARSATGAESAPIFEMERFYTAPNSQTVDPPLAVGDVLRFRWIGERKPPGTAVRVAPLAGAKPLSEEGWEVYSHPKDDATSAFSVIPLKAGDLTLPEFQVEDADGKVLGRTRAGAFKIAGPAGSEPPQDLAPLARLKFPKAWAWGLFIGGLLLAFAAGYLLWLRRRRRSDAARSAGAKTARPALPEDEEALSRLEKIEREGWIIKGEPKRHYFGVSEALKHYIERRFGFDAAEQTTRELLRTIESRGLDAALCRALGELFEVLDRVKFTDFMPEAGSPEPLQVLESARVWIRRTRKRTEAPHAT